MLARIERQFSAVRVVALLGPRQSGKTTAARMYTASAPDYAGEQAYFDLEDPDDLRRLADPKLALGNQRGLVVIDEIQRAPDLFPVLRVLVDRPDNQMRLLILGSASHDLIRQSSESLAGRLATLEVTPFSGDEVDAADRAGLWLRGGFPPSFLADDDAGSWLWRKAYVQTFLERDIPALGIRIGAQALHRFWQMLAHYHGQILNASELGRSLGIGDTTIARYVDILVGTFMVRRLAPWFENIKKRQVKRPKVYLRDSGILHQLLGIRSASELLRHPKLGASWEGFALEEAARTINAAPEELYFWSVHAQAELDLLLVRSGKKIGFEFKFADAPSLTASMRMAQDVLALDQLIVVRPDGKDYALARGVEVTTLESLRARAW